jgi:hypothetical protein
LLRIIIKINTDCVSKNISRLVIVSATQYTSCEVKIGILKIFNISKLRRLISTTFRFHFKTFFLPSFLFFLSFFFFFLSFFKTATYFPSIRCALHFFCNTHDFCMSKHFIILPCLHSKASKFQQSIIHPSAFHINTQELQICFSQNILPLQEAFCIFCFVLQRVGFPGKEAAEVPATRSTQSLIPDSLPSSDDNRHPYALHYKTSGRRLGTIADALNQQSKCGVRLQVRPEDAYEIFLRTSLTPLINGNFIRN